MSRIAWMVLGALAAVVVQATSAADDRAAQLFAWGADCSKGSVAFRVDCLTRKLEHIEARLDGRLAQVVPLGPDERIMPPWPPLPAQPSPQPQPHPLNPVPAQPPVSTPPK
jgi:hypothetical protein